MFVKAPPNNPPSPLTLGKKENEKPKVEEKENLD